MKSLAELKRELVPRLSMDNLADLQFDPRACACGGPMLGNDEGVPQCELCGVCADVTLDHGPEWRFGDECSDERPRCGPPPLHPMIPQAAPKPALSPTASVEMRNIRRWLSWVRTRSGLGRDYMLLCAATREARLPEAVALRAADWFQALTEVVQVRAAGRRALAAAALGLACREAGAPRSHAELVRAFPGLARKDVVKADALAANAINMLERCGKSPGRPPGVEPAEFIARLAEAAAAPGAAGLAKFMALRVNAHRLTTGHSPHAIAAVCLCMAGQALGLAVDRAQLREATDLSEVTFGKIQKKLHAHIDAILPSSLHEAYNKNRGRA